MPKRFIKYSRTQPARTILAVAAVITFLAGLFLLTPWFVPVGVTPVVSVAFSWPLIAGGIVNTVVCIPALIGVKRNTPKWVARGAFWLFTWYLFVTCSRMILGTFLSLTWVTTLIIAGILSVVYIEQSWLARAEARD